MKFAIFALILGCVALAYKTAARSEVLYFNVNSSSLRHWFAWPHIPELPPACCSSRESLDKPLSKALTKAEALILIEAAALKHRVAAAFVKSIVAAESNFDSDAVSPKGAIGLMQLMPDTARQFGADPTEPAQNVDAGTHYLRLLMNRYQKRRHSLKCVIAAYNAGPRKVDHYRGVPPYRETRAYVARVLSFLRYFDSLAKGDTKG